MNIDYSRFERGVHFYRYMKIDEINPEREICVQLEPTEEGELPECEKETLEIFLENYKTYEPILLRAAFEYYQNSRDAWGAVTDDDPKFPKVSDIGTLSGMIAMHGLMVRDEAWFGKRKISLFYNCTWDEEEGMGIEVSLGDTVSDFKVNEIGNIGDVY